MDDSHSRQNEDDENEAAKSLALHWKMSGAHCSRADWAATSACCVARSFGYEAVDDASHMRTQTRKLRLNLLSRVPYAVSMLHAISSFPRKRELKSSMRTPPRPARESNIEDRLFAGTTAMLCAPSPNSSIRSNALVKPTTLFTRLTD